MKRVLNKYSKFFSLAIVFLFMLSSCNEIDDPVYIEDTAKTAIFASMHEWYFWNKELPEQFSLDRSESLQGYLERLKYRPLDRWSYITTPEDFDRAFTGQNSGHGFGWALDAEENLYLAFVYNESPAGMDGWQRGWKVLEINGKPVPSYKVGNGYDFQLGPGESGVSNSFTFELPDGSITTRTITKEAYQANSVLYQNIYENAGKRIGYWVYNSFKATAGQSPIKSLEVEESLAYFEEQNIDELIIDLRYNGGGSVDVAEQIMNSLVPNSADGMTMYTNQHNHNKTKYDNATNFKKSGGISLDRIYFITSGGSASASELTINCLTPYMDVYLIGSNTYGKPVGAFPVSDFNKMLKKHNIELVPITFSTANADGKAEYFEGFPVDFQATDEVSKNWGDLEDPRLNAAIYHISNGTFPPADRRLVKQPSWLMIDDFEGLKKEFPAY
ncbi:S41 family peptidase [Echinicola shivajiensis]|uniref:S41 family peptidase n=1 Tax=Echinicola shivajiensis TaxID=1035916 RepID=UPI001BFC48F1|nr:S41 family peptidase [Echinicola shivajiensis]